MSSSFASHHLDYLPTVKPSAIALGTVFNHAANLAVLKPVFGDAYTRARAASSKGEFLKSSEAASAATLYGSTLLGSGVQTYAVAAVLSHAGVLSYKAAAYLGGLLFAATSLPQIVSQLTTNRRPLETVAVSALVDLVDTVGLSLFLTWWGTSPAHDLLR